jgi:hypothetical protein
MEATMAMEELARFILYVELALVALAVIVFFGRLVTPYSYRVEIGRYFRHYMHIE